MLSVACIMQCISYQSVHQTEHLWWADCDSVQCYNMDSGAVCRCIHEYKLHSSDDHMPSCVYVAIGPYTLDMLGDLLGIPAVNT